MASEYLIDLNDHETAGRVFPLGEHRTGKSTQRWAL